MSVTNEGDGAAESVIAHVTLPEGLTIAAPASGGGGMATANAGRIEAYLAYASDRTFVQDEWECETDTAATIATCRLDELDVDTTATLMLAVDINTEQLDEDSVTTFDVQAGDVSSTYAVRTALAPSDGGSNPLDPGYSGTGGEAVEHFGGTVMGCHATPLQLHAMDACRLAMSNTSTNVGRQLENNNWNMVQLNNHGGHVNSGLTTISLPDDATVKLAYLEWSANRHLYRSSAHPGDAWTGDLDSARIKIGAGEFATVHADTVDNDVVEENRQYYVARADITDLLSGITDTTVTVADIAVAAGPHTDPVRTYYGGFTLTIVYEDPEVPEGTEVALFEGPHWVKGTTPVSIPFAADSGTRVTPSWTAYEGDRGNSGDRVMLGGDNFVPYVLRHDGTYESRHSDDAADSWANGSFWTNTMGIDAHRFAGKLVNTTKIHNVQISTNGDNFMIGTFAITLTPPATGG